MAVVSSLVTQNSAVISGTLLRLRSVRFMAGHRTAAGRRSGGTLRVATDPPLGPPGNRSWMKGFGWTFPTGPEKDRCVTGGARQVPHLAIVRGHYLRTIEICLELPRTEEMPRSTAPGKRHTTLPGCQG